MNNTNLTPWVKGQSGNPLGKKKGSRHLSTMVFDLLSSNSNFVNIKGFTLGDKTPIEAIIIAMAVKAIKGDVRAAKLLLKHFEANSPYPEDNDLFSARSLTIKVIEPEARAASSIS